MNNREKLKDNIAYQMRPYLRNYTRYLIMTKQYYEKGLFNHNNGKLTLPNTVKSDFERNLRTINQELALRN